MKAVLPALIIVLFATIVTGRAGSGGSASGDVPDVRGAERPRWLLDSSCTVTADPPVRDRRSDRILGPARYRCDRPGADLELTVYLQRRAGNGAWTTVDSRPVAARGADTTRDRSERQRTQSAAAACADGTFRTFVRGTTTIEARSRPVESDSIAVSNPCRSARLT